MAKTHKIAESRARYYIRKIAKQKGWNTEHLKSGGDCLEEQEIMATFPDMGLGLERPDFLFCLFGEPCVVIETKNDISKINKAIEEAIDYATTINDTKKYRIKVAVGAAGDEATGFIVYIRYFYNSQWIPLFSHGYELTTLPTKNEIELALQVDDGTTTVTVPGAEEFIDAAIELSRILRLAKVEAPLRPKVIGAIVLAMYQGKIKVAASESLASVNDLVEEALNNMYTSGRIQKEKRNLLFDALHLTGADFNRLSPYIMRITTILLRLNIRSVLASDTDFLGIFYESFLRYGFDNNSLGIVFTPRHITKFCVELVGVLPNDRIIDIASGTGGFLVAAYDVMMKQAIVPRQVEQIKNSIYGFDTNPTIWALANLNMFFRGDGKSHIELGSCFDSINKASVNNLCNKAFLNPPFSQQEEPESLFIDTAMESLQTEGIMAVVVYAGIFCDNDHIDWRKEFYRKHTILGLISLPEDLFYPNASAPTTVLIAKAHIPQSDSSSIFMARINNDGFEKLKNRRVPCCGSQLQEVAKCFKDFLNGIDFQSEYVTTITAASVKNGEEWSPQQWSPQANLGEEKILQYENKVIKSIFEAITLIPDLADEALEDFTEAWSILPELPLGVEGPITDFFEVYNGRSQGEKNYMNGSYPYISSGESCNSIIRLVDSNEYECFMDGGITVTAFGKACIQPWAFVARGNGGSSAGILIPKYRMSFKDLVWFATQINTQQWRFFYARQAIKSRLQRLMVSSPNVRLSDDENTIFKRIQAFNTTFSNLRSF